MREYLSRSCAFRVYTRIKANGIIPNDIVL
jgi:hypothetical protein